MRGFLLGAALLLAACTQTRLAEQDPTNIDPAHPPAIIETSFLSHGDRLNGLVYLANGAGPHPTILLLHGYPGNEKNLDIAQYLRRDGWNVLFFHYRGAWGSEGSFSFLNAAEDVGAALDHIRKNAADFRTDTAKIAIVGHSMGGKMTLAATANDPEIMCAATMAASPVEPAPADVANKTLNARYKAYADGLIMLAGHDGDNVLEQNAAFADIYPLEKIADKLKGRKLLMLAARNDRAVPLTVHESYIAEFSTHAEIDLTTKVFETDHSFNTHRVALSRSISDWLDKNCR